MEIKKMKRTLSLILVMLMIIGILPINVLAEREVVDTSQPVNEAAIEKSEENLEKSEENSPEQVGSVSVGDKALPGPNWEEAEEDADTGGTFWPLPQGIRTIYGQNGSDPLNSYGITYRGNYITDDGRIAITGRINNKQTSRTDAWKYYVMRFSPELFNKIDWNDSYITQRRDERADIQYLSFSDNTLPGPKKNTKSFPYEQSGATYGITEFHIILKDRDNEGTPITWDNTFKGKNETIQLRLFDENGGRIFSTSKSKDVKYTYNGYGAYTKSATIPGNANLPTDWMIATTTTMSSIAVDTFWTADTMLQLDKAAKKIRVVYLKTNTSVPADYDHLAARGEKLGIRQSFDPEFLKLLKKDKDGNIGTVRAFNYNEKQYGDTIPITPGDLNGVELDNNGEIKIIQKEGNETIKLTRDDKSVFIQIGVNGFKDKENEKLSPSDPNRIETKTMPKGKGDSFYFSGSSIEANMTVFEYNIDPAVIDSDLIKSGDFIKNFFFDTRLILDNNKGMRKFTVKLDKDLVVPGGKDAYFKIEFTPEIRIRPGAGSFVEEDIILNLGGPEGLSKSWKRSGSENNSNALYIPLYGTKAENAKGIAPNRGYTIKAGQEITIMAPPILKGIDQVNRIDLAVTKGMGRRETIVEGTQLQLKPVEGLFYNPMYIENSVSTAGGTAYRTKFAPIVDEIFTDGMDSQGNVKTGFTGYNKYMEGYVTSQVFPSDSLERTGRYSFASESDKEGKITKYLVKDGKISTIAGTDSDGEATSLQQFDEIKEEDVVKEVAIDGKTYIGFVFDIKKQYNSQNTNVVEEVKDLKLLKDMPIIFRTGNAGNLDSQPVVEQVQARITFDLGRNKETGQNEEIIKIAPLNKEYTYQPIDVLNDLGSVAIQAGTKNPNYKPSGFLPSKNALGQSLDNLRVDETKPTVEVDGKTYPNFLGHNGKPYDTDTISGKEAFMMRQWPEIEAENDRDQILGWTTVKLEDTEEKTAVQQFNDLKAKALEAGYVRKLEDWTRAETEAMIFDETSPIDKHRTVYAVKGSGYTVKLHANKSLTDSVVKEVTLVPDENGKIKIPQVYQGLENEGFKKDEFTFVGWTKTPDEALKTTSVIVEPDGRLYEDYTYNLQTEIGPHPVNSRKYDSIEIDATELDGVTDLYARYAPYIKVIASKEWEGTDATSGSTVAAKVGLLYRTAVGAPGQEVIHEKAATYYPWDQPEMYDSNGELKKFLIDSQNSGIEEVSWTLPGFNEKGERISYIAIEFDANKDSYGEGDSPESQFKAFRSNWSLYGISIHPNNTGNAMAKEQNLNLMNVNGEVDAYSGATFRTHNNEDNLFKGYNIRVVNTKIDLSDPIIKDIFHGENQAQITVNSAGKPTEVDTLVTMPDGKEYKVLYSQVEGETEPTYKITDLSGNQVDNLAVEKHESLGDTFIISYTDSNKIFRKGEHLVAQNIKEQAKSKIVIKTVDNRPESNHPERPTQEPKEEGGTSLVFRSSLPSQMLTDPDKVEFTLQGSDGTSIKGSDGTVIKGEYNKVTGEILYAVPEDSIEHDQEIMAVVSEEGKLPGKSETILVDKEGPIVEDANYKIEDMRIVATAQIKDKDFRLDNTAYIKVGDSYFKALVDSQGKLTAKLRTIIEEKIIKEGVNIYAFDQLNNLSITELSEIQLAEIAGVVEPWAGSRLIVYYEKPDDDCPVTIEVVRDGRVIFEKEEQHKGNIINPRVIVGLNITLESGDIVIVTPAKGQAIQGKRYEFRVN